MHLQMLLTQKTVLFRLSTLLTSSALIAVKFPLLLVKWVTSAVTICLISIITQLAVRTLCQTVRAVSLVMKAVSTSLWLGIHHGAELSIIMTGLGRLVVHIHTSSIRTHLLLMLLSMTRTSTAG